MKNNKKIIIVCSIILLCILVVNIILTMLAGILTFGSMLIVLFLITLISLILFATHHKQEKKKKSPMVNIEDTIVLKLDDLNSNKITAIRNKEELTIIDDTSIKEDLNTQRENNVTKESIEVELSKTIFINDLKSKMKEFEIEQEKIKQQEEENELKELRKLMKQKKND